MSIELNKEILEAIEKNLPSMTAGRLSEYIEQAKNNEARIEELEKFLKAEKEKSEARKKVIDQLNEQCEELKRHLMAQDDLIAREEALAEEQRNLKVTLLEHKLMYTENSETKLLNLVDKIFGNPYVKRTVATQVPVKCGRVDSSNYDHPVGINDEVLQDVETTETIEKG